MVTCTEYLCPRYRWILVGSGHASLRGEKVTKVYQSTFTTSEPTFLFPSLYGVWSVFLSHRHDEETTVGSLIPSLFRWIFFSFFIFFSFCIISRTPGGGKCGVWRMRDDYDLDERKLCMVTSVLQVPEHKDRGLSFAWVTEHGKRRAISQAPLTPSANASDQHQDHDRPGPVEKQSETGTTCASSQTYSIQ